MNDADREAARSKEWPQYCANCRYTFDFVNGGMIHDIGGQWYCSKCAANAYDIYAAKLRAENARKVDVDILAGKLVAYLKDGLDRPTLKTKRDITAIIKRHMGEGG